MVATRLPGAPAIRRHDRGVRQATARAAAIDQNGLVVVVNVGGNLRVADGTGRAALHLPHGQPVGSVGPNRAARCFDVVADEVELTQAHGNLRRVVAWGHDVAENVATVPNRLVRRVRVRVAIQVHVAFAAINAVRHAPGTTGVDGDREGCTADVRFELERAAILHADRGAGREGDVGTILVDEPEVLDRGRRRGRWPGNCGRVEVEIVERGDRVPRRWHRVGRRVVDADAVGDHVVDVPRHVVEIELPHVVRAGDPARGQHVVVGVRRLSEVERARVVVPPLGCHAPGDAGRARRIGWNGRVGRHRHIEAVQLRAVQVQHLQLVLSHLGGRDLFGCADAFQGRDHRVVAGNGRVGRGDDGKLNAIGIDQGERQIVRIRVAACGDVDDLADVEDVDRDRGRIVECRAGALKLDHRLVEANLVDALAMRRERHEGRTR